MLLIETIFHRLHLSTRARRVLRPNSAFKLTASLISSTTRFAKCRSLTRARYAGVPHHEPERRLPE